MEALPFQNKWPGCRIIQDKWPVVLENIQGVILKVMAVSFWSVIGKGVWESEQSS